MRENIYEIGGMYDILNCLTFFRWQGGVIEDINFLVAFLCDRTKCIALE